MWPGSAEILEHSEKEEYKWEKKQTQAVRQ